MIVQWYQDKIKIKMQIDWLLQNSEKHVIC